MLMFPRATYSSLGQLAWLHWAFPGLDKCNWTCRPLCIYVNLPSNYHGNFLAKDSCKTRRKMVFHDQSLSLVEESKMRLQRKVWEGACLHKLLE